MKMQICNPISRVREAITRTRHGHTSQAHVTPINHDEVMTILSSDRRRWTIEYLADQPANSTVTVSDLAEFVASRENDCTVEALDSKQRERVYISLVQSNPIQLQETFIEYDEDRKTITPTETPTRIWNAYPSFCETLNG